MYYISPPLCCILPVLHGSMFQRNFRPFLPSQFFIIATLSVCGVIGFKFIIYLSYEMFEFTALICFPVKCGLFHEESISLGYHILYSLTVVCITCCHGLYCHSCYLNYELGYAFNDIYSYVIIAYLHVCLEIASVILSI